MSDAVKAVSAHVGNWGVLVATPEWADDSVEAVGRLDEGRGLRACLEKYD